MVLAKKHTPRVISSRVNTLTAKNKVKVSSHTQMVPSTREISKTMKSMESENAPGPMAEYMMGNG